MAPDVHCFIVQHEQGFAQQPLPIEVDPVPSLNEFVVDNELRCLFDMSNECLYMLPTFLSHFLDLQNPFIDQSLSIVQ